MRVHIWSTLELDGHRSPHPYQQTGRTHLIHTHTKNKKNKTTELGADIILTLDECTPFHVDKAYTEASMERSHRWELRSLTEFIRGDDGSQVCGCWI